MRVIIEIFEKGRSRREVLVVGSERLPSITVNVSAKVTAELFPDEVDEPGLYMLQVGHQPDIRVDANLQFGSPSCKFRLHKYDSDLKQDVALESYNLFRGTMGTSYLYLMQYEHGDGRGLCALAEVTVLLDKTDFRGEFYDKMVKELLDRRLPHFVLEDFRWQMSRNRFSIGWDDGYASTESPDLMLLALGRVVSKMRSHLAYINESPNMSFVKVERRRRIGQLSRFDERVLRGVGAAMSRMGADAVDDVSNEMACECARHATCNTRAHAVISTFLKRFIGVRLSVIEENLLERHDNQQVKLAAFGEPSVWRPAGRNMYADERAVLDSLSRKLSLVRRLATIVKGLSAYGFLSASSDELTVFDVPGDEFSSNAAYRQLYRIILEFSRARFWWIGDKETGVWKIPKVELGENGESRLQLKYSIVYENWCFARLVAAMSDLGCKCKDNKLLIGDDSCAVVFSDGVLDIKIIHGVTAWAKRRGSKSDFIYTGGRAKKKTPDFALLITKVDNGKSVWVVADAKSDGRLRRHIVERRIEYATTIEWDGNCPFASVIFLSGEAEGLDAGVEFPPPPLCDQKTVDVNVEDPFDDHSGDDYRWTRECGIVDGEDGMCPYHGHVRANVSSDAINDSVFREFVLGLRQTALRLMA